MTDTTAQAWNTRSHREHLRSLREKIAAYSQTLAERDLAGRVLRLQIEARLQTETPSLSDTKAEKRARADEQYLAHERRSIQLTYDKAVAEAEAESLKFGLELQVADRALGVE